MHIGVVNFHKAHHVMRVSVLTPHPFSSRVHSLLSQSRVFVVVELSRMYVVVENLQIYPVSIGLGVFGSLHHRNTQHVRIIS